MKNATLFGILMLALCVALLGCPPADNNAVGSGGDDDGDGGGNDAGASVDHSSAAAVVAAYVKAINNMDAETMMACQEPVEAADNGDAGDGDAPEVPEYPKTTMKLAEGVDPWTSEDGEWEAYAIESSTVMEEGADATVAKYGQWVVKIDDNWYIPTTSAGDAPMDPTNTDEGSFMAWQMALNQ